MEIHESVSHAKWQSRQTALHFYFSTNVCLPRQSQHAAALTNGSLQRLCTIGCHGWPSRRDYDVNSIVNSFGYRVDGAEVDGNKTHSKQEYTATQLENK